MCFCVFRLLVFFAFVCSGLFFMICIWFDVVLFVLLVCVVTLVDRVRLYIGVLLFMFSCVVLMLFGMFCLFACLFVVAFKENIPHVYLFCCCCAPSYYYVYVVSGFRLFVSLGLCFRGCVRCVCCVSYCPCSL